MGGLSQNVAEERWRLSWHLPLRPSPPLSLRLMPMPTTATATVLVVTTVATGLMVLDTAMDSTTARERLRLSPRLMPTTDTDMALVATTVATGLTVSDTAMDSTTARGRLRLSPTTVSTLLITLLPLSEEPTLVPDATSPTPPEPSMLPRGRLRLTPTTTEDTVSDTGPTLDTEDTASD